jgi:hypothetical protein
MQCRLGKEKPAGGGAVDAQKMRFGRVPFDIAHGFDDNELPADGITFSGGRLHDAGATACNHADSLGRSTSGRPAELV